MSLLSGILLAFLPAAAAKKLESREFKDPEVGRLKAEMVRLREDTIGLRIREQHYRELAAELADARDQALRERDQAREVVAMAGHNLVHWRQRAIEAEMALPLHRAQALHQAQGFQQLGLQQQQFANQQLAAQQLPYQGPGDVMLGLQPSALAESVWRHCTCIPDRSTALRGHRIDE